MEELPRTQRAIVALSDELLDISSQVKLPELEEDVIIVRNRAMALQPVDTKMWTPGAVLGMDFAGEVIAMAPNTRTVTPLAVGDRVFGIVLGMHSLTPNNGASAQYIAAKSPALLKIPSHMSFEEGASLGTSLITLDLALFKSLQVPGSPTAPAEKTRDVLVYGGSTATGTIAIQLLKLSGLRPIVTCSPQNFDLVRSYGAEEVFDYKSPSCAADIRAYTKNSLKYVLDCISVPETMKFSYECIGRLGGRYTALEPYTEGFCTRYNVKSDWVFAACALGAPCHWKPPFRRDADPEARESAFEWLGTMQKLLDEGRLRTHPIQKMEGGLEGILRGIEMLRNKEVSGKKLVYPIH